ncbi:MAG: ATP-binding cassette domain-containing protein, partial [bacterium]|nr:ATP-binding cassette domain-containing protein [bacterium]
GPSGGGKSTIVKLLFRHYDPTGGRVLLDGTDVRKFARADFRHQLGYVPQEGQLFSATVAANIRFAAPEATDDEVRAAARLAGAETFIASLSKGYDTLIGEQGVTLSGGQRQRLCIARAVVGNPKVLVFDEATSALDAESERIIQDALETLRGTTTIIVIAHRLSTIRHADRILIVEDGRIVEEGSHAQLLRQNGLYQRLVSLQDTARA